TKATETLPPQSLRMVPCSSASRAWAFFLSDQDIPLNLTRRRSTLDDADRAQPRHAGGDAEAVDDLDDVPDVLVGLRHLLGERVAPPGARDPPALGQLAIDAAPASRLHRRCPAQHAAG